MKGMSAIRYAKVFTKLYVNMVAAGEAGGILDTILLRLATFLEKNDALVRKIKGAMGDLHGGWSGGAGPPPLRSSVRNAGNELPRGDGAASDKRLIPAFARSRFSTFTAALRLPSQTRALTPWRSVPRF